MELGDGYDVLAVHEAAENEDGDDDHEDGEVAGLAADGGGGGGLHHDGGCGEDSLRVDFPAERGLHEKMVRNEWEKSWT